jgi:hypothetical protein
MIPDFSGDFLNYDGSNDGDICIILDEGKVEFNEALKKNMFNLHVEKNGKTLTYSPNNTAGRALTEAFGRDTKEWIGKKFSILHVDKKMLIRPIKEQKI